MTKVIPGKLYRITRGWRDFPLHDIYMVTNIKYCQTYPLDCAITFLVGRKEVSVTFTRDKKETMEEYFHMWLEAIP